MRANESIDIVIYLSTDWKSYSASQKGYFGDVSFIRALSRLPGIRILCVNQPVTPVETTVKKRRKVIEWLHGTRLQELDDNLFLYTPFAFLHDMLAIYSPMVQRMNRRVLAGQIRTCLKMLEFTSPLRLAWIYHPLQYTYFGLADEVAKVYKAWDLYRIRKYSRRLKEVIVGYEKKILGKAWVVLTPCINLYKEMLLENKDAYFTPAGVDVELFDRASDGAMPVPVDMVAIRGPRIGFAGDITERVDLSLIRSLAEARPDWSIVMVGNVAGDREFLRSADLRKCKDLPNVHFLGFKEFGSLPSYIKQFDVCMLAHSTTEAMRYGHPYKTLQYLATGKPVVSTNIPDAHYYADVIKIARDREQFLVLVEESLRDNGARSVEKRLEFARRNTWDVRAKETYDILTSKLGIGDGRSTISSRARTVIPSF